VLFADALIEMVTVSVLQEEDAYHGMHLIDIGLFSLFLILHPDSVKGM